MSFASLGQGDELSETTVLSSSAKRRLRIVECVIDLLGTQGGSAVSHRAIDDMLVLPNGTTSNFFRTKTALLGAAYDRIAELDLIEVDRALAAAQNAPKSDVSGSQIIAKTIEAWVGSEEGLIRHRARLEIDLLASYWSDLAPIVLHHRNEVTKLVAQFLAILGLDDTWEKARMLHVITDGLIFDQAIHKYDGHRLSLETIGESLSSMLLSWRTAD